MSYAIVRVGGKQYRVEEGQSILVDRMSADEGDKIDLTHVAPLKRAKAYEIRG
jgi:large subunit ribosomal protein L21